MVSLGKLGNISTKNFSGNPVPVHLVSWNFMNISPIVILLLTNFQHNLAPEGTRKCLQDVAKGMWSAFFCPTSTLKTSSPQDPTLLYVYCYLKAIPVSFPTLGIFFWLCMRREVPHSYLTTPTFMTSWHLSHIYIDIYIDIWKYMQKHVWKCI